MANGNSLVHDPVMTVIGQNRLETAIISRHARCERSERVMATIVIVGEETANHRLVTLLAGHGHRVLEAADSEQALAIVRAEKPDLVLADILIGNMDGCQLVQSLRAEAGWARPRLIFLTAAYMETEARALAGYRSSSSSPPRPKRCSRASMRHFPGRHRRRESRPSSRPLPRHIYTR